MKYNVTEAKLDDDETAYYGKIRHLQPSIVIEETLDDRVKVQALIHEMVHGILHQTGHIQIDPSDEEVIACLFGCQLANIMRDNREFFQGILGDGIDE